MSTLEKQTITGATVQVGFEMERLIRDGWEIDESEPLQPFGFGLLVGMRRDATDEQLAEDAKPKLSRAEILAKARAAKADKAKETQNVEAA